MKWAIVSFSKQRHETKPRPMYGETKDVRSIAYFQNGANYQTNRMEPRHLFNVAMDKRAFRQAIYEWSLNPDIAFRKVGRKYAVGFQLLVLDFDGCEKTPEYMVNYATEKLATPNFWYGSMSYTKKPYSFRLVWVLDEMVEALKYPGYIAGLLSLFPEADQVVKDISRLWLGGDGEHGEFLHNELLNVRKVPYKMSEEVKEIARRRYNDAVRKPEQLDITGYDWVEALRGKWDIFDVWINGGYLDHTERWGIYSQMKTIYSDDYDMAEFVFGLSNPEAYRESDYYGLSEVKNFINNRDDVALLAVSNKNPNYPRHLEVVEPSFFGEPSVQRFTSIKPYFEYLIAKDKMPKC